ncbi:hypothetical protein PMI22_01730, partial [Pseudomonas sp. GM21]
NYPDTGGLGHIIFLVLALASH